MAKAKFVYIEVMQGVSCVMTPTQFLWEIRFHLADDRGRGHSNQFLVIYRAFSDEQLSNLSISASL